MVAVVVVCPGLELAASRDGGRAPASRSRRSPRQPRGRSPLTVFFGVRRIHVRTLSSVVKECMEQAAPARGLAVGRDHVMAGCASSQLQPRRGLSLYLGRGAGTEAGRGESRRGACALSALSHGLAASAPAGQAPSRLRLRAAAAGLTFCSKTWPSLPISATVALIVHFSWQRTDAQRHPSS